MPIPAGVDLHDAAGTARGRLHGLVEPRHDRGPASRGTLLLLHGGASGIGTHAIQVAHALGARVAVTAGSAEKLALCRELGADITINYRDEDFVERVRAATDGAAPTSSSTSWARPTSTATSTRWPPTAGSSSSAFQGGVKAELQHRQAAGQARRRHRDGAAVTAGRRALGQGRDRRRGGRATCGR